MNISYDFDANELRNGYLESCKRTHPDSRQGIDSSTGTDNQFLVIENAYNRLKQYLKNKENRELKQISGNESEEKVIEIKHTVPQHRQYLNFDGIGFGTPTERQKQYEKHRLMTATNNVNEMQINKIKSRDQLSEKNSIILKDSNLQREMKIKQGMERLVEDLIQESIAKGEFENLAGYGKPLKYKQEYPYLDSTTYKLNEILINNGFVPEWVTLEREIRDQKKEILNELFLLKDKINLNNSDHIFRVKQSFEGKVKHLNQKIDKYNTIVPILNKQQIHLNIVKEMRKLQETDAKSENYNNINIKCDSNENSNSDFNLNENNLKLNDRTNVNNCEDNVKREENLFKKILSLFS